MSHDFEEGFRMALLPSLGLAPIAELMILLLLLIVGVIIIIVVAKVLLFFLPAAIIAVVVWLLTDFSLFWAGVAFIIVAFLSLLRRK